MYVVNSIILYHTLFNPAKNFKNSNLDKTCCGLGFQPYMYLNCVTVFKLYLQYVPSVFSTNFLMLSQLSLSWRMKLVWSAWTALLAGTISSLLLSFQQL